MRFYHAGDDAVLYFARYVPAEPGARQENPAEDPAAPSSATTGCWPPSAWTRARRANPRSNCRWERGLPDHGSLQAEELMSARRFTWTGKAQRIRPNLR